MTEGGGTEYKESLDPTDPRDRLVLIKEIVAMCNADGGIIRVGVRDDGAVVGIPNPDLPNWDAAKIGDLLDRFLNPDHIEIGIGFDSENCPTGRTVVDVTVPRSTAPPLVLSRDGNYEGGAAPLFRKGSVLVRHNTKVEAAKRADFLRWREELRNRIFQQFQMVVEAPETAHLRVVGEEEVRDEPQYLLSRGVDLFRNRREKLLDGDDLQYLFHNRRSLDLSNDDVAEFLIQSSLRRRATLYFWLGLLQPSPDHVWEMLDDALGMTDRDKSDMAGAIPMVAAMYLAEEQYEALMSRMATSGYAHIREAGAEYPTLAAATGEIERRRNASVGGVPLSDLGDDELLEMADDLVSAEHSRRTSRPMSLLGLEYLARKLKLS